MVLVYAEHAAGKFKKSTFEVVSYGYAIANKLNVPLGVISIGDVSNDELSTLAKYGASKIKYRGLLSLAIFAAKPLPRLLP